MEGKLRQVPEKASESRGDILWVFYIKRGQYPPFQMMWYGGCYIEYPENDLPKSGIESGGY